MEFLVTALFLLAAAGLFRDGDGINGIVLLAYYGSWPVTAVETEHFSDAMATIGRERTRYLFPERAAVRLPR